MARAEVAKLPVRGELGVRLAIRAGALPRRRFVVFTTGRSGSVLLLSLLGSTPGIRCEREVLGRRPLATHPWRRFHAHAARAALGGCAVWGTSMHPEELLVERAGDRAQWLGRLHDSGVDLITLVRRNPVRAGISAVLAVARGAWHHHEDTRPPAVRLDPTVVLHTVSFVEQKASEVRSLVGERSHLALTYEDDLLTPDAQQRTVDRVRRYLQLPMAPASTSFTRLSAPLSEQIENFDEVLDVLRPTYLARHLAELS